MSTQVNHPWRTTLRTGTQAAVGLLLLLPVLVDAHVVDPDQWPWLAAPVAVAAAVARLMAVPQVAAWVARFVPWLAATPPQQDGPPDDDERGVADLYTVAGTLLMFVWGLAAGYLLVMVLRA